METQVNDKKYQAMSTRRRIASELELYIREWRREGWWGRWTFSREVFLLVKHHLPTITQALRGEEEA